MRKKYLLMFLIAAMFVQAIVTGQVVCAAQVGDSGSAGEETGHEKGGEAVRNIIQKGHGGANITWTLYDDGVLEFSGSGAMESSSSSSNYSSWAWILPDVKHVIINEGITSIGNYAFNHGMEPNNVQTVTIADSVESIGSYAFYKCKELKEVFIGKGVEDIGKYCFSYDYLLEKIEVSDENTNFKSVNNILYSFDGKTIYRYPHNGVTDCVIEEGVTKICDDAFGDIETLKTVTFPKTIDYIGYKVFDGCNNLKTIYGYTNSLEQSYAKTENIEFVSLGKKIAQGVCGERISENLSKDNAVWTLDEGVFTVTGSGKIDYSYAITPMWDRYCALIETLEIKDGITEIGSDMFRHCKYLKEISIPESMKEIKSEVFYECENLKKIVFHGSKIKIDAFYPAFGDCKVNTAGPLEGGYDYEFGWDTEIPFGAFGGCKELTSITIPESIIYIPPYVFKDCNMDNFTIYGYTNSYAETFARENNIHFVSLGNVISKPNDKSDKEEDSGLDEEAGAATKPLEGTLLKGDDNQAVYRVTAQGKTVAFNKVSNKKVTKVVIPDAVVINGIKYKVISISDSAFNGCKKLNSVTIGKNVTKIGNKAFFKCVSLKKINIPSKVIKIGKKAFYGCNRLKSIIIKTKKLKSKAVGAQTFKNIYKKAVIKVPKQQKKAYQKWLKKKGVAKTVKISR